MASDASGSSGPRGMPICELATQTTNAPSSPQYLDLHPSLNRAVREHLLSAQSLIVACRQCAKQFNPLWRRSHACGHCGYEYCSSCLSDGQALMPRRAGQTSVNAGALASLKEELGIGSSKAVGGGYEVEPVCLHCLSMLQGESPRVGSTQG